MSDPSHALWLPHRTESIQNTSLHGKPGFGEDPEVEMCQIQWITHQNFCDPVLSLGGMWQQHSLYFWYSDLVKTFTRKDFHSCFRKVKKDGIISVFNVGTRGDFVEDYMPFNMITFLYRVLYWYTMFTDRKFSHKVRSCQNKRWSKGRMWRQGQ